jgi:cytochrome c biogenesis protein
MYTGLKVVKDPGVWFVWCGCIMMLGGMLVAFFVPHKRLWVVLSDGRAEIYGHSSKHAALFRPEFQRMAEAVRTSLNTSD